MLLSLKAALSTRSTHPAVSLYEISIHCERDGHGEGAILRRQVEMGVIAGSVLLFTVFI